MASDKGPTKNPAPAETLDGDMGEGSFSETHQGQAPSPPNVKGPRHVRIPSKDKES